MLDEKNNYNTTQAKRLVDIAGTSLEASASGRAERYGRGKTSHTIHVWWARRPHAAMRALVFATLCKNYEPRTFNMISRLTEDSDFNQGGHSEASLELEEQYNGSPRVLDMFGGGGTIPYEAATLGARVSAVDYNPLSVFIQRSNLVYSQQAFSELGKKETVHLLEASGKKVLEDCKERTRDLYPMRPEEVSASAGGRAFAYFWTYKQNCHRCSSEIPLSKRRWLAKRIGKQIYMKPTYEKGGYSSALTDGPDANESSAWVGRSGAFKCPSCHEPQGKASMQIASDHLSAIGFLNKKGGKSYETAPPDACPSPSYLKMREEEILHELQSEIPDTKLPVWSGIVNPALYGMETHAQVFNPRQRVVILELVRSLSALHSELSKVQSSAVANYIVSALSGFLDQVVDWNSRLSMWIPQNEQVGRAFSGPGIAMLWDYAETDQFMDGPANLKDKLSRIVSGASAAPLFKYEPQVANGKAQELSFADSTFDAIVTDPPYYDNIFYNVLADFFYPWKKLLFSKLGYEGFLDVQSPGESELVATKFRQGSSKAAHDWYCSQLTLALKEARRVLKPDGRISFVYGHSSYLGWQAVIESFRASGLYVIATQPLAIERRQRPRSMSSSAVNTCIAIVARPKCSNDPVTERDAALRDTEAALLDWGRKLEELGWSPDDIGMAVFSTCVAALCRAELKDNALDKEVLEAAEKIISKKYPEFSMSGRKSI